ncbi:MAG: 3-phosphoshikimate 1-carboxyvinyltransferase [Phycisphaerae bacterium]
MSIERIGRDVRVGRISPPRATVRPPGSKSLTNRHLLCAALADGDTVLRGASMSDDAHRMIAALAALGVHVESDELDESTLRIRGCAGHLPESEASINAGDAGTAMRFLTALCCLGYGDYRLDGSHRMRERPIGALVDGLRALGAGIGYDIVDGYPPMTIVARSLQGGEVVFDHPMSSQFLSAILLVAPYATRDVLMRIDGQLISRPYLDMTLGVLQRCGVDSIAIDDRSRIIVPAQQRYRGGTFEIEPDASGATYFWAGAAITGGSVTVDALGSGSAQGDVRFVDVLERMGCRIERDQQRITMNGPPPGELRGVDVDLNEMPDTAQTLAVTALFARGPTTIRNVANLRVKETDRLAALECELLKCGARVQITADSIRIEPPPRVAAATIDTYNDHRMAMSFAIAGLVTGDMRIRDAGCVAKSFPNYFELLGTLG